MHEGGNHFDVTPIHDYECGHIALSARPKT